MNEITPSNVGLGPDNADELRKEVLYDVLFSGGNLEWYCGSYDLPPGGDETVYADMTPARGREVVASHVAGDVPVSAYVLPPGELP